MKNNLLTIGDISKRTGCSIKSLRYYDSIGILKPAYVDKETNYRYYTFEQTRIVEIIQLCIMLDIKLKDVNKLTMKEDNTLDYSNLIKHGKKITTEKILDLQNTLIILDNLQDEIERMNSYGNEERKEFYLPAKYYYTQPLFETEINDNYFKLLNKVFTDALNQNLFLKNDYGTIISLVDNKLQKFVAVEVDEKHQESENVITIKKGSFLCQKTNEFDLNKIIHLFSNIQSSAKTIIITQGYSYDFSSPYFEAKCSL